MEYPLKFAIVCSQQGFSSDGSFKVPSNLNKYETVG